MKKIFNFKFSLIYTIPFLIFFLVIVISFLFSCIKKETKQPEQEYVMSNESSPVIEVLFSENNVESVSLDEYLVGVVAGEMPPSFEVEALKAQAVAARTYIINKVTEENALHPNADVCTDPSHCKAYINDKSAGEKWGKDWVEVYKPKICDAVYSTFGEVVTYDNEPIVAVFHSTSAGKTENSEDVWQNETPYLKSVVSEGEELSPRYKSTEEFTIEEFKAKITELNPEIGFLSDPGKWIESYEYTEGGYVKCVKICGCVFRGTEIREKFSLRSANFSINISDKVTFNVTGNGHGVGMSQYGANYAASQGSTYDEILLKYYVDTKIEKRY